MKTALLALLLWNHPPVRDWQVCLPGMHGQQVHAYCLPGFTQKEALDYVKTRTPWDYPPCIHSFKTGPCGTVQGEESKTFIMQDEDKTCGRCHKGLK